MYKLFCDCCNKEIKLNENIISEGYRLAIVKDDNINKNILEKQLCKSCIEIFIIQIKKCIRKINNGI